MKEKISGKTPKRLLLVALCAIGLLSIIYIFVLPGYVIGQLEKVKKVVVSQEAADVLIDTEDKKVIAQIMEYLDVKNAKRIFEKSVGKDLQSLPSLYINLDDKYMMAFWVHDREGVCYMDLYYHLSGIELGSYEIDIDDYRDCLEYLQGDSVTLEQQTVTSEVIQVEEVDKISFG